MEQLHHANIYLHIIAGFISLVLGILVLFTTKGGKKHKQLGIYFLKVIFIVIITGIFGVFVFNRNPFLLVITILSGYVSFSGYRAITRKSNSPEKIDIIMAIFSLLVWSYFIYYFNTIDMIWSPIIIYSTSAALIMVIFYDFIRYFIPREKYTANRIWLYEHIYKMISAVSALFSAFSGTVLNNYQPYSQYIPSILGLLLIIGWILYAYKFGLKNHAST